MTDHPTVISGNATNDIMKMPYWISKWLKDNFISKKTTTNIKKIKKIYIDRGGKNLNQEDQRLISNEDEIKKYLLNKGFVSIKMHETKFIDQVELFHNAECIVGLHGAGFANLAFSKPETKVIELRSSTAGTPIENLAIKNNLNYSSIIVDAKQIEKFDSPNQQGSIKIPINNLIKIIEK